MKTKFQVEPGTRLHITSTNQRREKHGDEKVYAIDVGVRWETSNDVLGLFDARLKGRFFQKAKAEPDPPQKELDLPVSDLPVVTFPDLGTLAWTREYEGYVFDVRTDTGDAVKIGDCKLAKFRLSFVEGGSTIVTFRVQSNAGIGKDEYGTLGIMLDRDVEGSLTPPVEGEQASMLGEVKPLGDGQVVAISPTKKARSNPMAGGNDGPGEFAEQPGADAPHAPGSPEAALFATERSKVKLSPEAAWPFPGTEAAAAMSSQPPSGNVLAEGETPAQAARITKAKKAAEKHAAT